MESVGGEECGGARPVLSSSVNVLDLLAAVPDSSSAPDLSGVPSSSLAPELYPYAQAVGEDGAELVQGQQRPVLSSLELSSAVGFHGDGVVSGRSLGLSQGEHGRELVGGVDGARQGDESLGMNLNLNFSLAQVEEWLADDSNLLEHGKEMELVVDAREQEMERVVDVRHFEREEESELVVDAHEQEIERVVDERRFEREEERELVTGERRTELSLPELHAKVVEDLSVPLLGDGGDGQLVLDSGFDEQKQLSSSGVNESGLLIEKGVELVFGPETAITDERRDESETGFDAAPGTLLLKEQGVTERPLNSCLETAGSVMAFLLSTVVGTSLVCEKTIQSSGEPSAAKSPSSSDSSSSSESSAGKTSSSSSSGETGSRANEVAENVIEDFEKDDEPLTEEARYVESLAPRLDDGGEGEAVVVPEVVERVGIDLELVNVDVERESADEQEVVVDNDDCEDGDSYDGYDDLLVSDDDASGVKGESYDFSYPPSADNSYSADLIEEWPSGRSS
ncbi:Uncharacterized protein Rs2_35722 [Raphanus sativus]|nr:Uncharacterized protein Rs2_35722 [Raphanus sativus]